MTLLFRVKFIYIFLNPPTEKRRDEDIYKPENGRGGKTATNPTNLEQKFINLVRHSAEAGKGGLKYVLRDETVYTRLEQSGISEGTGVKEGLLKKSGFEEFEIRDYREGKMKGSNKSEREALAKMEVASEKIVNQADKLASVMFYSNDSTVRQKTLTELGINSKDLLIRFRKLYALSN